MQKVSLHALRRAYGRERERGTAASMLAGLSSLGSERAKEESFIFEGDELQGLSERMRVVVVRRTGKHGHDRNEDLFNRLHRRPSLFGLRQCTQR